jgi:hypothetical protein
MKNYSVNLFSKKPHWQIENFRRFMSAGLVALLTAVLLVAIPRGQAQSICSVNGGGVAAAAAAGCKFNKPTKLVFLIDRSGSMALRGQTYNAQLEGIRAALNDPTIIPRDGSIEVGLVVFAGSANILPVNGKPLTQINSFADAEAVAATVATLRCADLSSQIAPCPSGETSINSAIFIANVLVSQNGRTDANRLFVLSTDGQTSAGDISEAVATVNNARTGAITAGVSFELDAILMGLNPDPANEEFVINKARVDQLVTPPPVDVLPGATLVLASGECNTTATTTSNSDCQRQINDIANDVRAILRSAITSASFVVNTEADTAPFAPPQGDTLSLRQAIEAANCNGGDTTITFDAALQGKTISPLIPLPALARPNITINGCSGNNCAPIVTIDGANTDVAAGEAHSDGILIRSYNTTVRGLRIINFKRAGIAIDPICPFDVTIDNLVELNVLEKNSEAGVLVRDPIDSNAIVHSLGNTISRNNISDSPTLIDLNDDGPTPNDTGDVDEGPNHLLNFPNSINVVTAPDNRVTISGQLSGEAAAGAVVELFAVTKISVANNAIVIGGVTFIGATETNSEGVFTASGLATSPVGIYTATVTDLQGNTSELLFDAANSKPGRSVAASATPINFGDVTIGTTSAPRPVQITNSGNAPLIITGCAIVRCAANDTDNTARFAVVSCPTAPINPGQSIDVNVTFSPFACGAAKACVQFTTNDPLRSQIISELNANGNATGTVAITLEGNSGTLDFGTVGTKGKGLKLKKQPRRNFTVQNIGCQPLTFTIPAIVRTGTNTTNGKISTISDPFFTIVLLNANGTETPVSGSITLAFQQTATFRVRFNPRIPEVDDAVTGLAAEDVLPDVVTSQVRLPITGGNLMTVDLVGRVTTALKLINPTNTTAAPVVNFTRSGDEFTVEFSIFDPNLNTSSATFEFINNEGRVKQTITVDLAAQIQARGLVRGQSFTVTQKFTGARDNRDVNQVRLSVTDGEATETATVPLTVLDNARVEAAKIQNGARITMPIIHLSTAKNQLAGFSSGASNQSQIRIEAVNATSVLRSNIAFSELMRVNNRGSYKDVNLPILDRQYIKFVPFMPGPIFVEVKENR